MWHQSQSPTQYNAQWVQMRLLERRLRRGQQIKCELNFYSCFKVFLAKPILRNPQCTRVPERLTLSFPGWWSVLVRWWLPSHWQHAGWVWDSLQVRSFAEGMLFVLRDDPGRSSRNVVLVLSFATYMTIMAFCLWNVLRWFLLVYLLMSSVVSFPPYIWEWREHSEAQ